MAYSNDLRTKIINAYLNKEGSLAQLAADFRVGESTVNRLWALYQKTGDVQKRPHGGGNSARIGPDELLVIQKIAEKCPDATIEKIGALFDDITRDWPSQQQYSVPSSSSVISRALTELGLTRKKKAARPKSERPQRSKKRGGSTKK